MVNKSTAQLITIFSKAGLLKDIKRTGWVVKGIKNAESVADHSWRMSFLVILLAPKNLNRQKLLEMSISSQEDKRSDEFKAFQLLFKNYGDSSPLDLLREFNEQKTEEAKFVKQIDKLEMALQALEYEQQGWSKKDLNEFPAGMLDRIIYVGRRATDSTCVAVIVDVEGSLIFLAETLNIVSLGVVGDHHVKIFECFHGSINSP